MEELKAEWREIKGYGGRYLISSYGKVKSVYRNHSKIMKQATNGTYPALVLSKNGKTYNHTIHRLVAEHFIENKESKPCINHKDLNKFNNHFSNLEWVTYEENNRHAAKHGVAGRKREPRYNYKGKLYSLTGLAEISKVSLTTLKYRLQTAKWNIQKAVETPTLSFSTAGSLKAKDAIKKVEGGDD